MQPHPDRRRPVPHGITVEEGAAPVFRAAIAAGALSAEPKDRNRAGHYFYMFHAGDGSAWFRQSPPPRLGGRGRLPPIRGDTRAHVTATAGNAGGAA
ncbi:MAG: hypothetical protein OXH14_09150 [Alphaproteobacteria bacterium]|nr:hypothetical protein [Alphaproteobacteria bacterium]